MTSVEDAGQSRCCAVIYNPPKVSDKFSRPSGEGLQRGGWRDTLWLETSWRTGRAMTREAVAETGDLVLVLGGDGTIRYVADGSGPHWDSAGLGPCRHRQSAGSKPGSST